MLAYSPLGMLRADPNDAKARTEFEQYGDDLGCALLLHKRIRPDIENATQADITKAAWGTVPRVALLFWSFRIMVGCGFFFILLFGLAFYLVTDSESALVALDFSRGVEHFDEQCSRHSHRLHRILFNSAPCRHLSHGQGDSSWPSTHCARAACPGFARRVRRRIGSKGAHHVEL
jgi:Cytochrome bd terminal oxidase subunit I